MRYRGQPRLKNSANPYEDRRWLGANGRGNRGDPSKELGDTLARQAPRDKDQTRATVAIRQILELDRRMSDMLNKMDNDGSAAFLDGYEVSDTARSPADEASAYPTGNGQRERQRQPENISFDR